MRQRRSGPVKGLRVVVLARQMTAKVIGMVLADMGATVVELVRPDAEVEPGWELAEQFWRRGKDLVAFDGAAGLAELLAVADIFICDGHTDELAAIDAAPDALCARYPDLVCLRISGYGATSAREMEPWSETLVMTEMGFPWTLPGDREGPKMPSFPAGSYATVFNGISGLMAALRVRHRTGAGQVVDTSIYDGLASQQPMAWFWGQHGDDGGGTADIAKGGMGRLVLAAYRCGDGEWIHVHTGAKGAFTRLMKVAGLDDRITPLPTAGLSEIGQPIEPDELALIHETLPKMFATKPRAHWLAVLRGNGIPTMPDLRPGECFVDPNVLENQLTTLVDLPTGETVRGAGVVLKYSETPGLPGTVPARPVTRAEAVDGLSTGSPVAAEATAPVEDKPLAGLRVLDFGVYIAGPYASRILNDLGADVIKVENPAGCPMRPISQGRYFNAANRGKRTLAIDLKQPGAREIVARLVETVDVVQHNLRPGTAESLGIGYADMAAVNPRLIYCHSPAFGLQGPYRKFPGFEPLSSAVTGLLMRREGCAEDGPQAAIGSMDPGNGMLGAAAILMALYHRDRTGEGQFIECPQMGSAILSTPETIMRGGGSIVDPCLVDADQFGFSWFKRFYQARDGWLVVDGYTAAMRQALLEAVGGGEDDAAETIADWAARRSLADAVAALRAVGVAAQAVAPAFRSDGYFFDDENIRLDRVAAYSGHPKFGAYRDLGGFLRFSRSTTRTENPYAAGLGAHTAEILRETGWEDSEIEAMIAEKVVVVA